MKKLLFIGICGLLLGSQAKAQFNLSGELRPRTEYSHGYSSLAAKDQDPSLFTSQRTRLNFDYKMDMLKVGVVLQDVRIWGSQPQQIGNEDYAVSIHQAWADMNFSKSISLKIGRQELNYDDQRIFGNVGWSQQARSHDVALFKYAGKLNVHFGIAHHENTNRKNNLYDGPDAYKDLQFVWVNRKTEKFNLSLLFLNNGKPVMKGTDQETKYSQTFGTHVEIPIDKVSFAGNLYFQTGEDGINHSLNAYNLLAEAAYQLSEKSQFLLGYEILSGTSYSKTEKNSSFTPLYGTNHKFNGYMDYFYVGNHLNSVGLSDAYLKFNTAKGKFQLNADVHFFASAAKISETANNYLGTEFDLSLTRTLNPYAKITLGYSQMFGTESLQLLRGGSKNAFNNWAYLMFSVTPKFL